MAAYWIEDNFPAVLDALLTLFVAPNDHFVFYLFESGPAAGPPQPVSPTFVEPTWSGYVPKSVSSWGASVYDSVGDRAISYAPTLKWTVGAVGSSPYADIAGFFVMDDSPLLLAYGYFPSPILLTGAGQEISVQPVFWLDQDV